MKKNSRRFGYAAAIFLSGLVLLISLASIAGVWIAEQALAKTAVEVLEAVGNITESLRQAALQVDEKLARIQAVSTFVSTASAKLSQNVIDQGLIMLLLPEEKEQDLVELSTSIQETIAPLRDMLMAGSVIYRSIDRLPFVDLPGPGQDQISQLEKSVGEIRPAAERLELEIGAFRSGTSMKIDKVEEGADKLTLRVEQARDRLAELNVRLVIAQERLIQLQQTAVMVLMLASVLFTLFFAWLVYSQVELIRLYVQRWNATSLTAAVTGPVEQADRAEVDTDIDSASMVPDKQDFE